MFKLKIKTWLVTVLCAGLVSCGGSTATDTSSGTAGVTYTGSTVPAKVTAANADSLAGTVATGSSGGVALAGTGVVSHSSRLNFVTLTEAMLTQSAAIRNNVNSSVAVGVMQSLNQTVNGVDVGGSGSMSIVGSIDDVTSYGSFTMTMNQFNDGVTTMNGVMTVEMSATGASLSFSNVTVVDATGSYAMDGNIKVVATATGETITMNFAASDSTGLQVKLENFVMTTAYDVTGAVTSESMSGRIYDSVNGYLDITTTTAMVYSPAGVMYPSSGGPVTAVGDAGTKVRVTPIDATTALVEADTTGDGAFDYSNQVAWSAL